MALPCHPEVDRLIHPHGGWHDVTGRRVSLVDVEHGWFFLTSGVQMGLTTERLAAHYERETPSSSGPMWANASAEVNPPTFPMQVVFTFGGHRCLDIPQH